MCHKLDPNASESGLKSSCKTKRREDFSFFHDSGYIETAGKAEGRGFFSHLHYMWFCSYVFTYKHTLIYTYKHSYSSCVESVVLLWERKICDRTILSGSVK